MMDCRTVRWILARGADRDPETAAHLAGCPECRALARRWEMAREALAAPASALQPDGAFARRVVARLPPPEEVLGWAALRALPAALALALVLAWMGLSQPPSTASVLAGVSGDGGADLVLTYAALAAGEAP